MILFSAGQWLRVSALGALILVACFAAGCAHHAATANVPSPPSPSSTPGASPAKQPRNSSSKAPAQPGEQPGVGYTEEGVASWYGFPFQGRRTSDGEIYDMNTMVAAHRTLPFNTIVRVTNLSNGLQTEVRIVDRGPFVEGRIIDLSLAAAKVLGVVGPGTAPVRLELVSAGPVETPGEISGPSGSASGAATGAASSPANGVPTTVPSSVPTTDVNVGVFAVQIGAFTDPARAGKLRDQLAASYPSVSVQKFEPPTGTVYRVFVGRYPYEPAAEEVATQLQAEHGYTAFVVRVDPTN